MNSTIFDGSRGRHLNGRLQIVAVLVSYILQSSALSFAESPQEPDSTSSKVATPVPKLSPAEQQQLKVMKMKLVTPLNSKVNPGDRDTWFVLGFMDIAASETRSREATPLGGTGVMWSDHRSNQKKVVKESIVVQGRAAAALAVLQYVNSSNGAAAQLKAPSAVAQPGWIKQQTTQSAASRQWIYRAFSNEREARQFLENTRKSK